MLFTPIFTFYLIYFMVPLVIYKEDEKEKAQLVNDQCYIFLELDIQITVISNIILLPINWRSLFYEYLYKRVKSEIRSAFLVIEIFFRNNLIYCCFSCLENYRRTNFKGR